MIRTVHCPSCSTAFPVDPRKVPIDGVYARCSACDAVFFVDGADLEAPQVTPEAPVTEVAAPAILPTEPAPPVEVVAEPVEAAVASDAPTPEPVAPAFEAPPAIEAPPPAEDAPVAPEAEIEPPAAVSPPSFDLPADDFAKPSFDEADIGSAEGFTAFETAADDLPALAADPGAAMDGLTRPSFPPAEPAEALDLRDADGLVSPGVSPDDWVFETDPEVDPASLHVKPLDTIQESLRRAQDLTPTFRHAGAGPIAPPPAPAPDPTSWVPEPEPVPAPTTPVPAESVPPAVSSPAEPVLPAPVVPEPVAPPAPAPAPPAAPAAPKAFGFGKRDPHEKASRLARVLVSDIITYNPERHQRALDQGTLKADFDDEIKKSWGEYVDQVGKEMAETTPYFQNALNEILARGHQVF